MTQIYTHQDNLSALYFAIFFDQYSTSLSYSTSQSSVAFQFQHLSFIDRFSSFISQQEKDRDILREFWTWKMRISHSQERDYIENVKNILQRYMFRIQNYKKMHNEHSRQYRVVIVADLLNSLITRLKENLYIYKVMYRTMNQIKRYFESDDTNIRDQNINQSN